MSKNVAPWEVVKVRGKHYAAVPVKLDESYDLCAGCVAEDTGVDGLCGALPHCGPGLASPCHLTWREVQIKGEHNDMVSKDIIQNKTAALVRIIGMFPNLPDDWQDMYPPQGDYVLRFPRSHPGVKECMAYTQLSLLSEGGFVFVGAGCFGMVVQHETCPGVVFKISARLNDAYGAFALYARDCAGNPHLPVIYDIQTGYGCMVVALEELHQVNWYGDLDGMESAMSQAAHAGASGEGRPDFDGCPDYEDAVECAYEIGRYFNGVASIDIHGDNIMQRDDGTLVITDPVSYTKV